MKANRLANAAFPEHPPASWAIARARELSGCAWVASPHEMWREREREPYGWIILLAAQIERRDA